MVVIAFPQTIPEMGTIWDGMNLIDPESTRTPMVKKAVANIEIREIFSEFGSSWLL